VERAFGDYAVDGLALCRAWGAVVLRLGLHRTSSSALSGAASLRAFAVSCPDRHDAIHVTLGSVATDLLNGGGAHLLGSIVAFQDRALASLDTTVTRFRTFGPLAPGADLAVDRANGYVTGLGVGKLGAAGLSSVCRTSDDLASAQLSTNGARLRAFTEIRPLR